MAGWIRGVVSELLEQKPDLIVANVVVDGRILRAAAFPTMVAELRPGDEVVVNTTGIDLNLGTGGDAFVLWNLSNPDLPERREGHIVKLRYTPWQTEVLAAEAPESPHHAKLKDVTSIDGTPVVVCGVHSHLGPVAAGIKEANPAARVGYLMTDGAALPLAWSNLVRDLKESGLVDVTCTSGHAVGGDLEAVNHFSGMAALKAVGDVDAIVVAMGPGVVGTDSSLGFTAMEQGPLLDAAGALGGRSIACLRVSFVDERERHYGISHHCLTALTIAAQRRCTVAVPELLGDQAQVIAAQLDESGIAGRHLLVLADGTEAIRRAVDAGVKLSSMGRTLDDNPEFFLAAGSAGAIGGLATLESVGSGHRSEERT
ncbi:MAG: DUF3866 family protein [Actinomycetota bacterium]